MKKPVFFLMVLCVLTLILATNFVATAASFEGDASYLFGLSGTKSRGFAAHARVNVMDAIFVDGSFLSTNTKVDPEEAEAKSLSRNLLSVGALYRTVNDPDLDVFVGAGFQRLNSKEGDAEAVIGQGIYGKFGFRFLPMPELLLTADLTYAPRYKEQDAATWSSLITARATVAYEFFDGFGIQGTIKHYKASQTSAVSDTLVGGGVSFHF